MQQRGLELQMETLARCPALNFAKRSELKIAPNDMLFPDGRCAILKCKQSDDGEDFAVSHCGLQYNIDLENQTPGVQTYVLLVDREGRYINRTTTRELMRHLNGTVARPSEDPRFGPYYWVDKRFINADRGGRRSGNVRVDAPPWLLARLDGR
jgi:hypothetical protein